MPPPNIPPPSSTTNRRALPPPPTASEAAFEHLLATFDLDESQAGATEQRPTDETAFLERLFDERERYLERDRYASIGDATAFFTKIVGVTFEGRQDIVAGLVPGQELQLVREPGNAFDPSAIGVRTGTLALGYVRREIAKRLAPNIDRGDRYTARVGSVTGGGERSVGVNVEVRRHRSVAVPATNAGALRRAASADALRVALIGDRSLRDAQDRVLERIAAGANTLAVMGTGRGKSVCFQLPAARLALERGGKTLVFYPLRALANDQFEALSRRLQPFGLRVLRANGSIDGEERHALDDALETGAWDVILATPEFATYHRAAFLRSENRPAFVVVDEAHHVFESRHRPAYGELGSLVRDLGSPQVLALTATANEDAFAAIRNLLQVERWVIDPTVRENLQLVDARKTGDKFAYLLRELAGDGKAIVYANSRTEVTKLAERLRARFGPVVGFYHAGVPTAERAQVEDLFRRGVVRVMVATSAFGEGVDLPDVRDVVLYHLNFDFTEFNQMAGRGGRDGDAARIHLLYGDGDRRINDFIIGRNAPTLETLRETYRGLRGLARDGMVRQSYDDLARTLDIDVVDRTTIGTAVRIFEEAGLAVTGTDDDGRFARLLTPRERVDLTATARYAEGLAEREGFERFCELALTADVRTLEQIVNRPIYPDRVPLLA